MASFSVYPEGIDGSSQLPVAVDNLTPVKAEVVNRHRDAILAIESELGIDPSGTYTTVRARLDALDGLLHGITIGSGSTGSGTSGWGYVQLTSSGATLISGFNVGSVTRTGLGSVTVTFSTPLTTSYIVIPAPFSEGGTAPVTAQTLTQFSIERGDAFGNAADLDFVFIVVSLEGTVPGSGGSGTGSNGTYNVRLLNNADYTAVSADSVIIFENLSTTRTLTLPSIADLGKFFFIKDKSGNASTHNIIIDGNGNLIDGASSVFIVNDFGSLHVVWDGFSWNII